MKKENLELEQQIYQISNDIVVASVENMNYTMFIECQKEDVIAVEKVVFENRKNDETLTETLYNNSSRAVLIFRSEEALF